MGYHLRPEALQSARQPSGSSFLPHKTKGFARLENDVEEAELWKMISRRAIGREQIRHTEAVLTNRSR